MLCRGVNYLFFVISWHLQYLKKIIYQHLLILPPILENATYAMILYRAITLCFVIFLYCQISKITRTSLLLLK